MVISGACKGEQPEAPTVDGKPSFVEQSRFELTLIASLYLMIFVNA